MFSTFWPQLQIGPFLRRESDWRFYHNLFKRRPQEIGIMKQLWLQTHAGKIAEPSDFDMRQIKYSTKDAIIVFKGRLGYFRKLNGWDEFLLQEIRSMTKIQWLKEAEKIPIVPIGIHVRLGDFYQAKTNKEFYIGGSLKTPMHWFIKSLEYIRKIIGFPAKAYVVSDGREKELKGLLKLKNVILFKSRCAISGLLFLSRAKILIASRGSSFSAWASFLGQMPAISHPGQSFAWYNLINRKGLYLGEFNPDSPPPAFDAQV